MKTPNLSLVASLVVAAAVGAGAIGCDAEAPPAPDGATDDDLDDDDDAAGPDEDDDDLDDDDDPIPPVLASPGVPPPADGLHPCGNGVLDAGETCDDGLANGDDRECTLACTFNDCDLDAQGVCIDHWPAADVDLYPCAELAGTVTGCDLDVAQ